MYKHIGKKIKRFATNLFLVVSVLSLLLGCYLMTFGGKIATTGVIIMIIVPILMWLVARSIYKFGRLMDDMIQIEENIAGENEE